MLLRRAFSNIPKHAYEPIFCEAKIPPHFKFWAIVSTSPIVLGSVAVTSCYTIGLFPTMILPLTYSTMAYTAGHTIMMSGVHLGLVGALHLEPGVPESSLTTIQMVAAFGFGFVTWMSIFNFLTTSGHSIYFQANLAGLVAVTQLGLFGIDSYTASVAKRAPVWWTMMKRNITVAVMASVLGLLWGSIKHSREMQAKPKEIPST